MGLFRRRQRTPEELARREVVDALLDCGWRAQGAVEEVARELGLDVSSLHLASEAERQSWRERDTFKGYGYPVKARSTELLLVAKRSADGAEVPLKVTSVLRTSSPPTAIPHPRREREIRVDVLPGSDVGWVDCYFGPRDLIPRTPSPYSAGLNTGFSELRKRLAEEIPLAVSATEPGAPVLSTLESLAPSRPSGPDQSHDQSPELGPGA